MSLSKGAAHYPPPTPSARARDVDLEMERGQRANRPPLRAPRVFWENQIDLMGISWWSQEVDVQFVGKLGAKGETEDSLKGISRLFNV